MNYPYNTPKTAEVVRFSLTFDESLARHREAMDLILATPLFCMAVGVL
ncbi:hypothetical protein THTE_3736 [Thermogutta terrifontis]|uniref:Uncharacterized protein n=1 Tax=Thermogutta terrifontis TaxID=1331910 RepID=A0A286RK61_9BACT|nr:hypothetical protein [Thermogutta terrifontis]ASV76337.1 hypothetical protein THTE_3736 [Thermogutta terrifontis]